MDRLLLGLSLLTLVLAFLLASASEVPAPVRCPTSECPVSP